MHSSAIRFTAVATSQHTVGPYRMFHLIRAGAAYEIWAVRPLSENTPYAMKWLPPGDKHNRATVTSLRSEYQVGRCLDHPYVINIYEFANSRDGAYMTMELFRAPNLKQRIHMGVDKMHWWLHEMITKIVAALSHMHEEGWIHRDIKPDNFLVNDEREVRLIDFNLAQRRKGLLGRMFGKSKVQGTQSYISPEQIRGHGVDHRADIYSLGCMMFEMVHGKPPFTGTSSNDLLNKHLRSKPPSLVVSNENVEPAFAELVQQMMAKQPEKRPDSLDSVEQELSSLRIFRVPPKPPQDTQAAGAAR